MSNNIKLTDFKDLVEINPKPFSDHRGLFISAYKEQDSLFKNSWGSRNIAQINISRTNSVGVIRGLHYQMGQYSEAKLVRCIKGKIFDLPIKILLFSYPLR